MKNIKLVIFSIAVLIVVIIYSFASVKKTNYVALGDSLAKGQTPFETFEKGYTDYLNDYIKTKKENVVYNNSFTKEDYRITDLINDIKYVKTGYMNEKKTTINQVISSSDITTLSIGSEELFYKIYQNREDFNLDAMSNLYKYADTMFKDLSELVTMIKKLNKKPLIILGYYNPITEIDERDFIKIENLFNYIEEKFKKIEQNYNNVYYIPLKTEFDKKSFYLPNVNDYHPSLEGYNFISDKIIGVIEKNKLLD